ncbi:MAG: 16S rRNA (cytosine(967)-C(5))-methyltransferase RsmB [Gammaproteobacteria bacterium]
MASAEHSPPSTGRAPGGPAGPSLAVQLVQVARCVKGVGQGQSLTDLLTAVPAELRPGVQALSFHVLRRWGRARALVRRLALRKPEPATDALLTAAVALMPEGAGATPEKDAPRYSAHTVVDQAVEAAKKSPDTRRQAGFINACLRRLLREAPALAAGLEDDVQARWNHPAWWVQRLRRDHPDHWQAILDANDRPGPMTLRINRRQVSRDAYREQLLETGLQTDPVGEDGLVLQQPQPVHRLPGFDQGLCSVQDAAAQLAAPLLLEGMAPCRPDGKPWRVLDACAAPGGKTAHLLERADLDLLALDLDPVRCARIGENLRRLGLSASVRAADAAQTATWWDGRLFDAILLDAPCSASGIVRRHPDVRWLRRETDVGQLAETQRRLLDALWPLLAPGGHLLYATCSVFRDEGERQASAFLSRHKDALHRPSAGHLLPGRAVVAADMIDNVPGGYDGFFYARFDKRTD